MNFLNRRGLIIAIVIPFILDYLTHGTRFRECITKSSPFFDTDCIITVVNSVRHPNVLYQLYIGKIDGDPAQLTDWWMVDNTISDSQRMKKKVFVVGTYKTGKSTITSWLCGFNELGDIIVNTKGLIAYECGNVIMIDTEGFYQPLDDQRADMIRNLLTSIVIKDSDEVIIVTNKLFQHEIDFIKTMSDVASGKKVSVIHNIKDIIHEDDVERYRMVVSEPNILNINRIGVYDVSYMNNNKVYHYFTTKDLYRKRNIRVRDSIQASHIAELYDKGMLCDITQTIQDVIGFGAKSKVEVHLSKDVVSHTRTLIKSNGFELVTDMNNWKPMRFIFSITDTLGSLAQPSIKDLKSIFVIVECVGIGNKIDLDVRERYIIIRSNWIQNNGNEVFFQKQILVPKVLSMSENYIKMMRSEMKVVNGYLIIQLILNDQSN